MTDGHHIYPECIIVLRSDACVFKLYLDKLEDKKNGGNLFGGVGAETMPSDADDDLSWLNQL